MLLEWFTNILIRIWYLKLCQMQKGPNNWNCETYCIIIYDLLCTWIHVHGLLLDCVSLMQTHNCFYFYCSYFPYNVTCSVERMYNLGSIFLQLADIWASEENFIITLFVFIFSKGKIAAILNLFSYYEQKKPVIFH